MGGRWERPAGPPSLPTTHPGAPRLSANSPGSPGLRKQGLRPQRKGGAGEGGQKPARGFAWASRAQRAASCGGGQRDEHTHTHTHTHVCTAWSTCPAVSPSFTHSCPRLTSRGDRARDAKALGEVAFSFQDRLGQRPCCLDGNHYCFRGQEGAEVQPGSGTPKSWAAPTSLRRSSAGPGPWKAALRVHSFLRHGEGERALAWGRPSPGPRWSRGPTSGCQVA